MAKQAGWCPFCDKRYVNKTALSKHLKQYITEWRLPVDGKHYLLEVQNVLHPNQRSYQCWTCSKILESRGDFQKHVIHYQHCGLNDTMRRKQPTRGNRDKWMLPFDEKLAIIEEKKFNFLGLPTEVRLLIYQHLFCYEEIQFEYSIGHGYVDPRRDGLWLQRNPPNNLMAIMPVSRKVYNEAREVFYTRNKFMFESVGGLSVFLVGIGPRNVKLLRSVWQKTDHGWENVVETIRQCLPPTISNAMTPNQEIASLYAELKQSLVRKHFPLPLPGYDFDSTRLVRPEVASGPSSLDRWRYKLHAYAWNESQTGQRLYWKGRAAFELCIQRAPKEQEGPESEEGEEGEEGEG
ncbi:uncharacterized protein N7515_006243 [Penicillium bovifimosum]|uniref:C2H2-type domain-containing protein n=1 Tax=Penicillium bovifimosum TaxID=126998 RepID=A0A9W9L0K8_9EURO|nr:uncharacterized protein N7515_006243 [Penicillium bovifimosum]KAJ5130204.1 hypothetical protein N7515_006243 [Penicillium bovifimosum]